MWASSFSLSGKLPFLFQAPPGQLPSFREALVGIALPGLLIALLSPFQPFERGAFFVLILFLIQTSSSSSVISAEVSCSYFSGLF